MLDRIRYDAQALTQQDWQATYPFLRIRDVDQNALDYIRLKWIDRNNGVDWPEIISALKFDKYAISLALWNRIDTTMNLHAVLAARFNELQKGLELLYVQTFPDGHPFEGNVLNIGIGIIENYSREIGLKCILIKSVEKRATAFFSKHGFHITEYKNSNGRELANMEKAF